MGPSIFATDRPLSRHQEGRRQRGEGRGERTEGRGRRGEGRGKREEGRGRRGKGRGRRLAAKVLFHLVLPCSVMI